MTYKSISLSSVVIQLLFVRNSASFPSKMAHMYVLQILSLKICKLITITYAGICTNMTVGPEITVGRWIFSDQID